MCPGVAGSPGPDGTTSVVAPVSDPYSTSERAYHQPASRATTPNAIAAERTTSRRPSRHASACPA